MVKKGQENRRVRLVLIAESFVCFNQISVSAYLVVTAFVVDIFHAIDRKNIWFKKFPKPV